MLVETTVIFHDKPIEVRGAELAFQFFPLASSACIAVALLRTIRDFNSSPLVSLGGLHPQECVDSA